MAERPSSSGRRHSPANIIETLEGHGASDETSVLFILETPNVAKPDGTLLVEVTVEEYDLLWNHILNEHSRAERRRRR